MAQAKQQTVLIPEERPDDEVLADVLAAMEQSSTAPRALNDFIVEFGAVRNPYQFAYIRRQLLKALKPGGSHHHLTTSRRWIRTTERWADPLGIPQGKAQEVLNPALRSLEEQRSSFRASSLPDTVKKAADTALDVLTTRAGKRLDQASLDIAADALSTIMDKADTIARENEILKAWNEDATKTRDNVIEVLRNLSKSGNLPQAAE